MSGFGDSVREAMAENIEQQIENGGISCTTDNCESEHFDAEVGVSSGGGFEGAAICRECNTRINLNFEDSQAQESLSDIEDTVNDF